MIKRFLTYVVACLPVLSAWGQNVREDMRKINAAYERHENLSMGITYNVFADYKDQDPLETSTGSYFQTKAGIYNRLNEIESVQNKENSLVIDNEQKVIVIGNPVKFKGGKAAGVDMDTSFSKYASVKYLDVKGQQKGYSMVFKSNMVSEHDRVDVFFNSKTYLVEKMVYYYRDKVQLEKTNQDKAEKKPKLEVVFSNIRFESGTEQAFYSESRFINKKGNKYEPAGEYAGYKIINQKIAQ